MFNYLYNLKRIFRVTASTVEKPEALFIEHSYRKKTQATRFLSDLLQKHFSLKFIFDDNWKEGRDADVPAFQKHNYVFFCQVIPNLADLSHLARQTTVVWFPMYDAIITGRNKQYLWQLSKIPLKTVCFSSTLYQMLQKFGMNCFYLQYYPDPKEFTPIVDYTSIRVYFWYRRDPINWQLVKTLLAKTNIAAITIKNDPDPGNKPLVINSHDIKKYSIRLYSKHLPLVQHRKVISQASVYMAPRILEGIGVSFVEALTQGQCVIAPNQPTMNEYIRNNSNGYLYNVDRVKPLDLGAFAQIGKNARHEAKKGYQKWQQNSQSLISFITNP
ncbi:TPA: hypothetical protein DIV55_03505 [Patescibacteria group bacterium]|uniref:Glycosyltransferase, group 1 family protein n=1 Tax=Candidatus Gottesmanbacteria bacterium GW2011_GWA1_43_11 TaxID=1618436 RepID=A0A0G1CI04_9BACT|nr:MAG: Glycosyltransferase, group 1 family protein [Candidatus Gottesmanbacteria bacterium GW2011_GWA1_43_11]HCS78786.1 hypothetical protein [Patescibacteria group bacterium]